MKFTQEQQKKSQELMQKIVAKAWDDRAFKKELIENPKQVIEKHTQIQLNLPEGKKLVVVDQTDENYVYLNIPHQLDIDELELSDEELEMVAGGDFIATACLAIGGFLIGKYVL